MIGSVATGTAGAAVRAGGTGTDPDFPGIRSRAKSSWAMGAHVAGGSAGVGSSSIGSGVLAVAATGGGVEARRRRRSSAAEMDDICSVGVLGVDIRTISGD